MITSRVPVSLTGNTATNVGGAKAVEVEVVDFFNAGSGRHRPNARM